MRCQACQFDTLEYADWVAGEDECRHCRPTFPLPAQKNLKDGDVIKDDVGGRWVYKETGCLYISKHDYIESACIPWTPTPRQKEIFHLMRGSGNPQDWERYGKPEDAIYKPPVPEGWY